MAKETVKYKRTGIEWMPEVPEHWEVRRLANFFNERTEIVSDKDYPPLSVTKNGILPQLETAAKTDHGDNRKRVCIGDFVINSRSDRKGSAGVSELEGSVSIISVVLKPSHFYTSKYTHYLLTCKQFQDEFYVKGKGIVDDMWSTKYRDMKTILLPVPPIREQERISSYIETQTEKIHRFITKKEQFIGLLREQRQSLINRAVTKGIREGVKMKDSGVEWLGEVPEGWEVAKLKRICSVIRDGTHLPPPRVDEGFPLLSVRNLVDGGEIGFLDDDSKVSEKDFLELNKFLEPRKDDLLLAIVGATMGKVSMVPEMAPFAIQRSLCLFRVNERCYYEYLFYAFQSKFFKEYLWRDTNYSAQPGIYLNSLVDFKIPIPGTLNEQRQIVAHIQSETQTIDAAIGKAEREIVLMKEYKEALVGEAVVGRVEILND